MSTPTGYRPDPYRTGYDTDPSAAGHRPDPYAAHRPARRRPAPVPRSLAGCAAVADALAALRAGARGPAATPRWAAALLGDDPRALRAVASLLRPACAAHGPVRPGGLALDLPARLLAEGFGAGRIVRFEDVDFPAGLTHEPSRRFLREVGLPEDGPRFRLDTDVPLPTLAELHALTDDPDAYADAPDTPPIPGTDHLIHLGRLPDDGRLLLDGTTGTVLHLTTTAARPLTTDLSTLALTLWLTHRSRTGPGKAEPLRADGYRNPARTEAPAAAPSRETRPRVPGPRGTTPAPPGPASRRWTPPRTPPPTCRPASPTRSSTTTGTCPYGVRIRRVGEVHQGRVA
ncbi:SUKH-4 family immunity protein [Streptomyces sp. TP-A0875]|uniref:SUKH-4 family immunity protein n=1 Tax=Streptomyces sp. TP-A0875 TaxID=552354 RepID=UPI0006B62269|nr:SUKH-4 family immunity protein [Streptomyces sp. TP-A0875]